MTPKAVPDRLGKPGPQAVKDVLAHEVMLTEKPSRWKGREEGS
jgi:hypothetical protein